MTLFPLVMIPMALAGPVAERLESGRSLVWAGIDTRALELYVPEGFDDPAQRIFWGPGGGLDDHIGTFDSPEAAWKQLCRDWNTMFVNERVPILEKNLEVRVSVDVPDVCGAVQRPPSAWFMPEFEAADHPASFGRDELDVAVKSWPVTEADGLALMVVAERYAKAEDAGCVWPVFFDLASREILHAERSCVAPRGISFRNYWLNPVVDTVKASTKAASKGQL